eukprot:1806284-Pleurochrysis_carterae.AAC.1
MLERSGFTIAVGEDCETAVIIGGRSSNMLEVFKLTHSSRRGDGDPSKRVVRGHGAAAAGLRTFRAWRFHAAGATSTARVTATWNIRLFYVLQQSSAALVDGPVLLCNLLGEYDTQA